MAKAFVTIVGSTTNTGFNSISIGDKVTLVKEKDNRYDADAVRVFLNDEAVAYIANKPTTVAHDCKSATEIQSFFKNKRMAKVVKQTQVTNSAGQKINAYIAELTYTENVETTTEEEVQVQNEYKVRITGSVSLYPNKFKVSEQIKKGLNPTIKLVNSGDKIVAYYEDGLCGYVDVRKNEGVSSYEEVKDLFDGERLATVISQVRQNYVAVFKINEGEVTKKDIDDSFESSMERVVTSGILNKKQLKERISFLKKNKVTKKQMSTLFASYKEYDEDTKKRIPEPKTLYQDNAGLIKKSIGYINVKRNLLFEGERGVGKNVLTETLAWLYNRPLFEFPMNSQHDNNSMLGGKTITTEVGEDGKEKTEISFDPDVIVQAGEVGGILVLDEFNTSFGHVMSLLNSYLDDRRRLQVPGYKTIELDPNTMVIATQNKDYTGTFENNEATVDRFVPIVFPNMDNIQDILRAKVPGIDYSILTSCQGLYEGIKKCVRDGEISDRTVSIRGFIDACLVTEQDIPIKEALIDNIANRASDTDERKAILDVIKLVTG